MTDEVFLNGILEDETDRYYHICFFGAEGATRDGLDNYVFVPKVVCRIAGPRTVAIQEWYVKKHKLTRFTQRYRHEKVDVDMDKIRLQQALKAMRRARDE